jgi:hypothetical protein
MNYEAERARRIAEIEQLWREVMKKPLTALDTAIKKKFEVSSGRDALTFESMRTVRDGLQQMKDKLKGEKYSVKK